MVPIRCRVAAPAVLGASLLLSACGSDAGGTGGGRAGPATVVATTSVWADIVGDVTCQGAAGVEVAALIPADADPHGYEPSLRDRQSLEEAGLVVANGRGLEGGVTDLLEQVDDGTLIVMSDLPAVEAHDRDDADDPHIWLDPSLVADVVAPLAEQIVELDGVDTARVDECAAEYAAELRALDGEVADLVATLPKERRTLVTNHDAYGYFADRYGFDVVGTVIPSSSTMAQTNPADLADLAATIEAEDVPVIFVDGSHSAEDAEALATTVGVDLVPLDTESVASGEGGYPSMIRSTAAAIVAALAG